MSMEFNWIDAVSASPVFIALIVCSAITLAVAIERGYYYWKRSDDPDKTLADTMKHVRSGEMKAASGTCDSTRHPVGTVLGELLRLSSDLENTNEELYVVMSQQRLMLERNLNVLATMAATAPLIGLLGTVWGIMRAFHDMANTGSAAPSVVAGGVAEALVTTGAGLVVAIPALMLYNHFSRRMNVMLTVAENHARSLRAFMVRSGIKGSPPDGGSAKPATPTTSQAIDQIPQPAAAS